MPEIVEVALDQILVDPSRFSPRAEPVDEAYLARLTESLEHDHTLPPLRCARPACGDLTWWGCPQHYSQKQRAGWQATERRRPYANLPLMPELVLYDGVSRYWALRAAEVKRVQVMVDDAPVEHEREVRARALEANYHNARSLTDTDLRTAFTRLWLGRELHDSHEKWVPERGAGMAPAEIAKLVGRSASWASMMQVYARVAYAVRLDLGLRKSYELGRLDADRWRPMVWSGEALRLWILVDELGCRRPETATVPEMSAADLRRLVEAELREATPASSAPVEDEAEAAEPEGDAPATEQYELPNLDLGDFVSVPVDRLRHLRPSIKKFTPEQARQFCLATAPLYIEVVSAYEEARAIAKRAGFEV